MVNKMRELTYNDGYDIGYAKGYTKARAETAKEIFERVDDIIVRCGLSYVKLLEYKKIKKKFLGEEMEK